MDEVSIVEVEAQTVLSMRKRGKYEEIPKMFAVVIPFVIENGLQIQGPPLFITREMSEEEALAADEAGNADLEVAVPISGKAEGTDEIKCCELPGGKMAKVLYKGPYKESKPAYEKLFAWLEENGKSITGPIRELYLNDPAQTAPEELLTEIYAPVE